MDDGREGHGALHLHDMRCMKGPFWIQKGERISPGPPLHEKETPPVPGFVYK